MKDRIKRVGYISLQGVLVVLFLWVCIFLEHNVYADEKRIVKVAFFPMEGYHSIDTEENYGGMDVDYLNALCTYADWEVRYVACDSWEEALELLKNQEVDLVGSAQYSAERAEIYQYADISSGYTFGVIATNADGVIAYEDFHAMEDITFGMVKNYVRTDEFLQYLRQNGIENPKIKRYDSTADMQTALDTGKVDAFVHTFTEVKEGQRIVGRFAPRPFYYITYKGNDDVMRELNQAVVDLKMNEPALESSLMSAYFYDKFDKAVLLTTEEKEFLTQKGTLVVGYLDNYYPFSYEEDGEFKGLTREMIEIGLGITGLKTEYHKYADSKEARIAVQNGTIDIFAYSVDIGDSLETLGLQSICEYAEIPLVLVTEKNKSLDDIKSLSAITFLEEKAKGLLPYDDVKISTFARNQEGIDAVVDGEVDAVLCNGYFVEYLMRTDLKYGNLQIQSVVNSEYSVSFAISQEAELLAGILEKTMSDVDSKMINEYMLKENRYVSITEMIKDNSLIIIGILVVIIILIICFICHMLRNSERIQNLMYKDAKMNIWNINYLIFRGERKILPERKMKYAVVYLNLASFRRYNIIYGWSSGEHLLENIVKVLLYYVDLDTEICARNQSDRFVLLLNYRDEARFMKRLMDLKEKIEDRLYQVSESHMTVYMGVYYIPDDEIDLQNGINNASQALEFVGKQEDDSIKVYDDSLQKLVKERHDREKLLDSVDTNQDFVVFYQPKVDIRSSEIVGAEALVRFKDPSDNGAIKAPWFFISYYEQTGKIVDLDLFVLESTCKMLRRRLDAGLPVVPVSCNFSRMHFVKSGFADRFEEILNRYDISKDLVEVEITETLVVEELHYQTVKENIDVLEERNIQLSIDDFGAGYSSLGIFEQIPASVVKMDRSFFMNQKNRNRQVKIMRGIVKLSEALETQVVCEGVETEQDVILMQEIGTYIAQGYFYSKPIPEDEFEERLTKGIISK